MTNIVALTVARNEDWVIGLSGRALLEWADSWVVLLHCCTDGTRDAVHAIAAENPGRVRILEENTNALWSEMANRQRTLEEARRLGATHCAVVDADEVLSGDLLGSIRLEIAATPASRHLGITMRNMHRSIGTYRSDPGIWGKQAGTMIAFADHPNLCWRAQNGYDHHHRHPHGSPYWRKLAVGGGLMHLQFASWRRLTAKHAWYKMIERTKYPQKPVAEIDRLYSMALNESGCEVSPAPAEWWEPYRDWMPYLNLNAEPWHERECRRLRDAFGPSTFAGLNLFGVVEA